MKIIILLLALLGLGYAVGIRVHPEALEGYFGKEEGAYTKLDLKQGKSLVGVLLEESDQAIRLNVAGSEVEFSRNEITSMTEISPAQIKSGEYDEWIVEAPKKPLFSYDEERNLISQLRNPGASKKKVVDVWGKRPRPSTPQTTGPAPRAGGGINVMEALSDASVMRQAQQIGQELDAMPKNPWVEALKKKKSK